MACCRRRTYWPPIAKLCLEEGGNDSIQIQVCADWCDKWCDTAKREVKWFFIVNDDVVFETPYGQINEPLAIGENSSYGVLNLPGGFDDVFSFLQNSNVAITGSDTICIQVKVKNCEGTESKNPSNVIKLFGECPAPWVSLEEQFWHTTGDVCWGHL